MDNIASATTAPTKKTGFFTYIFNDNYKGELLNIIQYSLFIIIPITILIRNINFFFPELDKSKGNLELLAEALGQLALTFIIIFFVHRIITYFNPWGTVDYPSINMPTLIMVFLWTIISFGLGHVGKKMDFILERLMPLPRDNFWNEDGQQPASASKGPVVRVTQPLAGPPPPIATHAVSRPDYITSQSQMTPPIVPQTAGNLAALPANTMSAAMSTTGMSQYNQQLDNTAAGQTSQMYAQHGMQEGMEPMAANSVLGGSSFSSF